MFRLIERQAFGQVHQMLVFTVMTIGRTPSIHRPDHSFMYISLSIFREI